METASNKRRPKACCFAPKWCAPMSAWLLDGVWGKKLPAKMKT